MHCWIELNAEGFRRNYQMFCNLVGKEKVAIVLKSNAYGHGLKEVYEILATEKPACICVAYLGEAEDLRKWGYKGRILIVAPLFRSEFSRAAKADAEIFVGDFALLDSWIKEEADKPKIHIKIDTGLSRQGFLPAQCEELAKLVADSKSRKKVVGICTHFANVEDVLEHEYANTQLERFESATKIFESHGIKLTRHAASSASTLLLDKSRFDLVRVGISLYGFWPSQPTRLSYLKLNSELIPLTTTLSLKTKIFSTKSVKKGQFIGYGCKFRANKDMRVAVLPLGYYEGYPRIAGEAQSYVLIQGSRCPLVGRISMNMIVIDVSHLENISAEEVVTLIGSDDSETIDASMVAEWAQTIHYELTTRLHPQIPKKII